MNFQKIYSELKRRNIFKVATAYAIAGWLIIQVVSTVSPQLGLPEWVPPFFTVLVLTGFPIALIIAWAFELTPEGLKKTHQVTKEESITDHTGKKINKLTLTALSLLVVFLLVERVFFAESTFGSNSEATFETASIAVLPFVNMSSDKENEYFSDGLSEELLNVLAKVEDMKVAGRTSSFKFKGHNDDLKKIGKELGVAHILEGSVRKSGTQVRITAQLIKVDDGYHLWSETYDRELKDIFAIQEEISRKVLNELKVRLLEEDEAELEAVPTGDVEAYQMFLKANQLVAGRDIDDINVAIDLYKNAVRLDPGFHQAIAKLAIAYNLQGYYGNVPFEDVQQKVLENAEQAIFMNQNSADGYAALGLYHLNATEPEKARDAYLQSLELNPNNVDVYNWLAIAYQDLGEPIKRNEMHKKMYELDPLSPMSIYNQAGVHFYEGEYKEAEEVFKKNIQQNPGFALSYTGLAILKGNPPFGQLDESFEYARTAMKYGRDARAIVWLIVRANDMDIEPVSDYYFSRLRNEYRQSFEYISIVPYYSVYKDDYTYLEKDVFTYLDETDTVFPITPYYYTLVDYLKSSGNKERVLNEFRKFDEGLFAEELEPLTIRNYEHAGALAQVFNVLGNKEKYKQLTDAFCAAAENLKDEFVRGEESEEYQMAQMDCHIYRSEYKQALPYLKEVFIERKRRTAAGYFFEKQLPQEAYEIEGYNEIWQEIKNDLERQKGNVITYLEEQGEWQEEWDKEL